MTVKPVHETCNNSRNWLTMATATATETALVNGIGTAASASTHSDALAAAAPVTASRKRKPPSVKLGEGDVSNNESEESSDDSDDSDNSDDERCKQHLLPSKRLCGDSDQGYFNNDHSDAYDPMDGGDALIGEVKAAAAYVSTAVPPPLPQTPVALSVVPAAIKEQHLPAAVASDDRNGGARKGRDLAPAPTLVMVAAPPSPPLPFALTGDLHGYFDQWGIVEPYKSGILLPLQATGIPCSALAAKAAFEGVSAKDILKLLSSESSKGQLPPLEGMGYLIACGCLSLTRFSSDWGAGMR